MEKQKEQKKDFCAQVTGELMLKEIQKGFNAENIVLSPLSYTVVLNMTAAGATGPTLKQMLEYLAVEKIDDLNTKFLDMAAIATTNSDGVLMDGLPSLLKKVNSDSNFFTQDFELWKETLDAFCIPKFKFSFTTEEGEKAMQEMGMTLPFEKTCKDLTEVVENKNISLYVSMIIQKAFLEIDEKCTEAAAVTFESEDDLGCCLYQSPPKKFKADHPFLFMIREEITRSVLFTGAVVNPLLNGSDDTTTMA
ncbi:serpin-ZXA-like [Nicotiana tomentosiformis]|uniref:serpin-ZXA-like n=1 Tax=Nicotiana tomentosiformis TaxID=4098 RepID=UPI00051ABDD6